MPSSITLYYAPGACSLGPHIVAEEAGLGLEYRRVDFRTDEQRSTQFLAVNSQGRVPVLEVDGEFVTEAPAVMLMLASFAPERQLTPKPATLAYARCLERVAWINSTLHIAFAQLWKPERFVRRGIDTALFAGQALNLIADNYRHLEARLSHQWMAGAEFSIADCYMLPFYRFGTLVGFPMTADYPRLTAWKTRMAVRASVQRALTREKITIDTKAS